MAIVLGTAWGGRTAPEVRFSTDNYWNREFYRPVACGVDEEEKPELRRTLYGRGGDAGGLGLPARTGIGAKWWKGVEKIHPGGES